MKKFYFLIMAMLIGFAASAAEYTVKFTNPNGWSACNAYVWNGDDNNTWPGTAMTQDGDVWTVTLNVDFEPTNIIFNDGKAQTGNIEWEGEGTYNMTGLEGAPVTYYTITFDNSESNWDEVYLYSWMGYSSAGYPGDKMTKGENNIYTIEVTSKPTAFLFNNGKSGSDERKTGDLADWADGNVYNMNGLVGAETTVSYALNGSWTSTNWEVIALNDNNGVWESGEISVTNEAASFGIQYLVNGRQEKWLWAADNTTASVGENSVAIEGEGGIANFTIATGAYTFAFNPESMVLTIAKVGDVNPVESSYQLHIQDTPGDDYSWNSYDMEHDGNGTYTVKHSSQAGATFGIKELQNGAQVAWHASSGDSEISLGATHGTTVNGTNFTIPASHDGSELTYSYTPASYALVVKKTTTTGIDEILFDNAADAEYYNLQGIRVANPTEGIYIRRQGNDVQKVYIR